MYPVINLQAKDFICNYHFIRYIIINQGPTYFPDMQESLRILGTRRVT